MDYASTRQSASWKHISVLMQTTRSIQFAATVSQVGDGRRVEGMVGGCSWI